MEDVEIENNKEYNFEINNIQYKLFIHLENKYIVFTINQVNNFSLIYQNKYELEQIINILMLNQNIYKDLNSIIELIDETYENRIKY